MLVVIVILGILAAILFVALDPATRFADARDARRRAEVVSILNAVLKYQVDNDGDLPTGIDAVTGSFQVFGTAGSGCDSTCTNETTVAACLNLNTPLVDKYLSAIPLDPKTGLFWLADVGQDLWEEIDLVEKGGNYGWEYREGTREQTIRKSLMDLLQRKADPPRGSNFLDPVHEYSHAEGLSITGGFVYRGKEIPALQGYYIYGDWKFGTVWGLKIDEKTKKVIDNVVLFKAKNNAEEKYNWTAFGADKNGEVLMMSWGGRIFRMEEGK